MAPLDSLGFLPDHRVFSGKIVWAGQRERKPASPPRTTICTPVSTPVDVFEGRSHACKTGRLIRCWWPGDCCFCRAHTAHAQPCTAQGADNGCFTSDVCRPAGMELSLLPRELWQQQQSLAARFTPQPLGQLAASLPCPTWALSGPTTASLHAQQRLPLRRRLSPIRQR